MHSGGSCGVQMPHKELVVHYHPARGVWVVLKGGFKGEVWSTAHSIRNARINNLESWHNARINRQNRQRKMANICGGKYSYVHVANGEPKSENRKHQWKKLFPNKLRKKTKQKEDGKKKNKKKNTVLYLAWAEALKWACHRQTLNFVRCMKILHNFIFIARNVESVGIGPGTNNRILWKQIYAQNEHS